MRKRSVGRLGVGLALVGLILTSTVCSSRAKPQDLNLVFILVDTLRSDAVFRGDGSAPALDTLAGESTVFTRAYAQASWTLPSVSSLLTGRWPSDSPGWADATQGIADSATPLAQILQQSGRITAAFVANSLLTRERFGRGFDSYWTPPVESGALTPAAEPVNRAIAWLGQHQRERFFLLVHLMDPHDPYCPPARRIGPIAQWPGDPNPSFTGAAPMPDAAKIRQWHRLYGEEVSYLDGQLSRLFAALDPKVRERTVFVLTADHGEEFLEHGFLRHGVTLFDEVIHVPLLIGCPGAPARRVASLVRLVDLVPTLADLLGVPIGSVLRSQWAGVSLAGAVVGRAAVPKLIAMGETFGFGPLRWYVYDGRYKVVLFNRDHQLPAEIPTLPYPRQWLLANLPREEVYVSTPDQPIDRPSVTAREERLVWAHNLAARYAMGKIGGLWISLRGPGRGGRLSLHLVLPEDQNIRAVPLFWRSADHVKQDGSTLDIDVTDDPITRLAVLVGATEAAEAGLRVLWNGASVPVVRGRPEGEEPALHYWFEKERPRVAAPAAKNEMLFRLRALGYIR